MFIFRTPRSFGADLFCHNLFRFGRMEYPVTILAGFTGDRGHFKRQY